MKSITVLLACLVCYTLANAPVPSQEATNLVVDALRSERFLAKKPFDCSKLTKKGEKKCAKKKGCDWNGAECVGETPSDNARDGESDAGADSSEKKVLFVGNSFTFMNKMPTVLFKKVAESRGKKVSVVDTGSQGGATLGYHLKSEVTKASLGKSKTFDYIVLQEQSMFLSKSSYSHRWTHSYQWVDEYAAIVEAKKAKPILYETWGYYNGYEFKDDYSAMQTRLMHGYKDFQKVFKNNHAIESDIAPVGEAWKRAYHGIKDPLDLYKTDGRHPEPIGSYIAALTIYCTIFKDTPVGAYAPKGISNADKLKLQRWAWEACEDELGL